MIFQKSWKDYDSCQRIIYPNKIRFRTNNGKTLTFNYIKFRCVNSIIYSIIYHKQKKFDLHLISG